jgi:hypothetical protein
MIALKKLVLFLEKGFNEMKKPDGNFDMKLLQSLTTDALVYLKRTKTFEYAGAIKLPGVAFKMVDLNMDLDDIVKELIDKRSDIEFKGELSIIIEGVEQDATKIKNAA